MSGIRNNIFQPWLERSSTKDKLSRFISLEEKLETLDQSKSSDILRNLTEMNQPFAQLERMKVK